jgi:hypothetical protein
MGGLSTSNFTIEDDRLAWDGDCRIVPSLAAPGFCIVQTIGLHSIGNVSEYTHLTFKVGVNYIATIYLQSFHTKLLFDA